MIVLVVGKEAPPTLVKRKHLFFICSIEGLKLFKNSI